MANCRPNVSAHERGSATLSARAFSSLVRASPQRPSCCRILASSLFHSVTRLPADPPRDFHPVKRAASTADVLSLPAGRCKAGDLAQDEIGVGRSHLLRETDGLAHRTDIRSVIISLPPEELDVLKLVLLPQRAEDSIGLLDVTVGVLPVGVEMAPDVEPREHSPFVRRQQLLRRKERDTAVIRTIGELPAPPPAQCVPEIFERCGRALLLDPALDVGVRLRVRREPDADGLLVPLDDGRRVAHRVGVGRVVQEAAVRLDPGQVEEEAAAPALELVAVEVQRRHRSLRPLVDVEDDDALPLAGGRGEHPHHVVVGLQPEAPTGSTPSASTTSGQSAAAATTTTNRPRPSATLATSSCCSSARRSRRAAGLTSPATPTAWGRPPTRCRRGCARSPASAARSRAVRRRRARGPHGRRGAPPCRAGRARRRADSSPR